MSFPSFVSTTISPDLRTFRPVVARGPSPLMTVPKTTRSFGGDVGTVTRVTTIGSAWRTPGLRATPLATDPGNAADVVNGPSAVLGTTHESARNDATVRSISLEKLEFMPASNKVIPKTRPVATTAIAKRRRRHSRSRRLISHISGVPEDSASDLARSAPRPPPGEYRAVTLVAEGHPVGDMVDADRSCRCPRRSGALRS